jgi:hypothetical protein
MSWEEFYNFFGIKEFIYFISSSDIQDTLLPVKLVCVAFTLFFLAAVIYFMLNSSWMQYKFLEDVTEFFSWQAYGAKQITKRWNKIKGRIESGSESEYKLAVIEAEDFLNEILEERGYEGEDFEKTINSASKLVSSKLSEILLAHEVRNAIVYNPDYKLEAEQAKRILGIYEATINSIGLE